MSVLARKRVGLVVGAPVAGDVRELADDEAFDMGPGGFVIGDAGAVIADLRVGENDDLPGIGGIGEDFLISGDRGIEDDFAGPFGGRTKTPALEDGAVFQSQDCRIQSAVPPWGWVNSSLAEERFDAARQGT